MRAFVEIRRAVLQQPDIKRAVKSNTAAHWRHDGELSAIYDAIENLLDEKAAQKNGKTGTGPASKNKNGTVPASHKSFACLSLQKMDKQVF
jgi:hypothetical protein